MKNVNACGIYNFTKTGDTHTLLSEDFVARQVKCFYTAAERAFCGDGGCSAVATIVDNGSIRAARTQVYLTTNRKTEKSIM
jgi:hypothetical protein